MLFCPLLLEFERRGHSCVHCSYFPQPKEGTRLPGEQTGAFERMCPRTFLAARCQLVAARIGVVSGAGHRDRQRDGAVGGLLSGGGDARDGGVLVTAHRVAALIAEGNVVETGIVECCDGGRDALTV